MEGATSAYAEVYPGYWVTNACLMPAMLESSDLVAAELVCPDILFAGMCEGCMAMAQAWLHQAIRRKKWAQAKGPFGEKLMKSDFGCFFLSVPDGEDLVVMPCNAVDAGKQIGRTSRRTQCRLVQIELFVRSIESHSSYRSSRKGALFFSGNEVANQFSAVGGKIINLAKREGESVRNPSEKRKFFVGPVV